MTEAVDVANFFINLYKDSENNDITNLKLNKLVYLSQALHLVRFEKPFFEEEVEAWPLGPVIPSVYRTFNICGRNTIQNEAGSYNDKIFTNEEIDLLLDIDENFGIFSASALVELTHKPGSPWKQYYNPDIQNAIIPKESMAEYYSKHNIPNKKIDVSKIPIMGYRNQDGKLILPAEEYFKDDDDAYNMWKAAHS